MNTTILLVDDNETNLNLMKCILEHEGYLVITAARGAKCLKMARAELPDLILLDIQMPDMDGFEVANALLTDVHTGCIPIVGISAYASPTTREHAIRLGMVGFFESPINHELFAAEIAAFLASDTKNPSDSSAKV